jgi:anti-sigma factor RsiW
MPCCERYKETLLDLLDGECDLSDKREVEAHLKECPECARFYRQLCGMRTALRNVYRVKPSENFMILLRDRIRREIAGKRERGRSGFVVSSRLVPAFGMGILVIAAGLWFILAGTGDESPPIAESSPSHVEQPADPVSPPAPVDYVIDDVPERVAISSPETDADEESSASGDSVLLERDLREVRSRITPVSF